MTYDWQAMPAGYINIIAGIDNITPRIGDTLKGGFYDVGDTGIIPINTWHVGETTTSGSTYVVQPEDLGRPIKLSITDRTEPNPLIGTAQAVTAPVQKKLNDGNAATTPTSIETTHNSVTLKSVESSEYSKGGVFWQLSPIFNGLVTNERYTFHSRIKETKYMEAGSKSPSLLVTTGSLPPISGGGGGGSGGGGASTPPKATESTTGNGTLKPQVDEKGNATATVDDKIIVDVIKKAQEEAKKSGTIGNGIELIISIDTEKSLNGCTVNLPKEVLGKLTFGEVNSLTITGNGTITFDLEALKQIKNTANTDVAVSITKVASNTLSGAAQKAIGGLALCEFKAIGGGKSITDFGNGKITIGLHYELQNVNENGNTSVDGTIENPEKLDGVYIGTKGNMTILSDSQNDTASKTMFIRTNHLSLYGVAYNASKPNASGFTDIENHWAKEDIFFVAEKGLLTGLTTTEFGSDRSMTRGMFVIALGRLFRVDMSSYKSSSFEDVSIDSYYLPYIEWAEDWHINRA